MEPVEQPDIKVLKVWRIELLSSWIIVFVVLLVPSLALVLLQHASKWWLLGSTVPLIWMGIAMAFVHRRWEMWTFKLTPHTLEMNHGWLVRHKRVVARNRIQHVDFESGPISRKLDLVHVIVHTAGAKVGTIPGISSERADRLRAELMDGPKVV